EPVDRATAASSAFSADFQDLITRYAWGEVWSRPGLDRRTRSCRTLAMLATLAHEEELALHVRAALRNGLTPEEIREVLLQVAVYAGGPAANRAFRVAQRALEGGRTGGGPARAGQAWGRGARHHDRASARPGLQEEPMKLATAFRPGGSTALHVAGGGGAAY